MSPETFSGRDDKAKIVKKAIQERANVLLYGVFGIGKTEFVHEIAAHPDLADRVKFQWPDLKLVKSASEFWQQFIKRLPPVKDLDKEMGEYRTLRTALAENNRQNKPPCVFVLDDFDALVDQLPDLGDVMTQLFMLQSVEKIDVHFIIVASTKTAFVLLDKNDRPDIYRAFKKNIPREISLLPLSHEEAQRLVEEKRSNLSLDDRQSIAEKSGGHPGLVVKLIESHISQKGFTVSNEYLTTLWDSLNRGAQEELHRLVYSQNNYGLTPEVEAWLQTENGLIKEGHVFSPLLEQYIRNLPAHGSSPQERRQPLTSWIKAIPSRIKTVRRDWSFSLLLFVLWFIPIVLILEVAQVGWVSLLISSGISLALLVGCAAFGLWPSSNRIKQTTALWIVLTIYYACVTVILFFNVSLWFFITFLGMIFTGLVLWRIIDWRNERGI